MPLYWSLWPEPINSKSKGPGNNDSILMGVCTSVRVHTHVCLRVLTHWNARRPSAHLMSVCLCLWCAAVGLHVCVCASLCVFGRFVAVVLGVGDLRLMLWPPQGTRKTTEWPFIGLRLCLVPRFILHIAFVFLLDRLTAICCLYHLDFSSLLFSRPWLPATRCGSSLFPVRTGIDHLSAAHQPNHRYRAPTCCLPLVQSEEGEINAGPVWVRSQTCFVLFHWLSSLNGPSAPRQISLLLTVGLPECWTRVRHWVL